MPIVMEPLAGVIWTHKLTDIKQQRSDIKVDYNFRFLFSAGYSTVVHSPKSHIL